MKKSMEGKKIQTDRQILQEFRNEWRRKLIAASIDQQKAEDALLAYPNMIEIRIDENGQQHHIDPKEIIKIKKDAKRRARDFVTTIDKLLKMEKASWLPELWSDQALSDEAPEAEITA